MYQWTEWTEVFSLAERQSLEICVLNCLTWCGAVIQDLNEAITWKKKKSKTIGSLNHQILVFNIFSPHNPSRGIQIEYVEIKES